MGLIKRINRDHTNHLVNKVTYHQDLRHAFRLKHTGNDLYLHKVILQVINESQSYI